MNQQPEARPILCLWGFMGTGKTTVGAEVAARCGVRLVDLDEEIVRRANKPIAEIFAHEGEASFRKLEKELLFEVLADPSDKRVVALGGGALVDDASRRHALSRAFVVTLTASVPYIVQRTQGDDHRPLLRQNRAQRVRELLNARAASYEDTHWRLDTNDRSPEEIASHILKRWLT